MGELIPQDVQNLLADCEGLFALEDDFRTLGTSQIPTDLPKFDQFLDP
jgi:hypothetical protein